jgi:hypothetical protein
MRSKRHPVLDALIILYEFFMNGAAQFHSPSLIYLDRTEEEGKPDFKQISQRRKTYDLQETPMDSSIPPRPRRRCCRPSGKRPKRRTTETTHRRNGF